MWYLLNYKYFSFFAGKFYHHMLELTEKIWPIRMSKFELYGLPRFIAAGNYISYHQGPEFQQLARGKK
jgi:hypothetical protein